MRLASVSDVGKFEVQDDSSESPQSQPQIFDLEEDKIDIPEDQVDTNEINDQQKTLKWNQKEKRNIARSDGRKDINMAEIFEPIKVVFNEEEPKNEPVENIASPSPEPDSPEAEQSLAIKETLYNQNQKENEPADLEIDQIKHIKVKQLDASFGNVYTPGVWREFEERLCKANQDETSMPDTDASTYSMSSSRLFDDLVHKLIQQLDFSNDFTSIKHYLNKFVVHLKSYPHLAQRHQLNELISSLFKFVMSFNGEEEKQLSGELKRALLLFLDTLAYEKLFDGKEENVVSALINLQGNNTYTTDTPTNYSDFYDLGNLENLDQVSQTAIMTASLDCIEKVNAQSGHLFESVLSAIEKLLESYVARDKTSLVDDCAWERLTAQLWFGYEALSVVCKSGYQAATGQMGAASDEFTSRVVGNMDRLGDIFAAGFKIHKPMVRRACYVILVHLLGIFSPQPL